MQCRIHVQIISSITEEWYKLCMSVKANVYVQKLYTSSQHSHSRPVLALYTSAKPIGIETAIASLVHTIIRV